MQIPVNKDLDSYKDDFFKGLTLKQTALSIISVAAGTGTFLFASYVLKLEQSVSFYLALPVVLPIAASGFLRIHGMTPLEYLKKRRSAITRDVYFFIPEVLLPGGQEKDPSSVKKMVKNPSFMLDDPEREVC